MQGSRLAAIVMLLSLLLICFISAPVFSAEDPWDVDGGGVGGDGSTGDNGPGTDSTGSSIGDVLVVPDGDDGITVPDWMTGIWYHVSVEFARFFADDASTTGSEMDAEGEAGRAAAK